MTLSRRLTREGRSDRVGQVVGALRPQREPLQSGSPFQELRDCFDALPGAERAMFDPLELARLDLREVKDVVDCREEVLGSRRCLGTLASRSSESAIRPPVERRRGKSCHPTRGPDRRLQPPLINRRLSSHTTDVSGSSDTSSTRTGPLCPRPVSDVSEVTDSPSPFTRFSEQTPQSKKGRARRR